MKSKLISLTPITHVPVLSSPLKASLSLFKEGQNGHVDLRARTSPQVKTHRGAKIMQPFPSSSSLNKCPQRGSLCLAGINAYWSGRRKNEDQYTHDCTCSMRKASLRRTSVALTLAIVYFAWVKLLECNFEGEVSALHCCKKSKQGWEKTKSRGCVITKPTISLTRLGYPSPPGGEGCLPP